MTWRVLSGLMAAAFVACAVVQHNDPDPWRWIAMYGLAAGLCVAEAAGRRWMSPAMLLGGAALLGAAVLVPGVMARTAALFDSEVGRELGGLLLVGVWSMGQAWRAR